MEAAVPLTGQVCGRIESVESVADIINGTVTGFRAAVSDMAGRYIG
jgi:enoyl-[acyl-carrier protein] reductase II